MQVSAVEVPKPFRPRLTMALSAGLKVKAKAIQTGNSSAAIHTPSMSESAYRFCISALRWSRACAERR